MFGFFLVTLVALVGGLIAFVGDRVGMRVGRKRLSLLGLRPKYTSIGIAVLTGVLTASTTLGILTAVSEDARQAVFHLDQLQEDLSTATSRNYMLKREYNRVNMSLNEVTKKWDTARAELKGINERIAKLTNARERAEKSLLQAQSELASMNEARARTEEQYAKAAKELAAAREEAKFLQQRKDNLENAIAILEDQIESLSTQREYLGVGVVDFATQPIIIHAGECLAATVAEPGKTFNELEGLVVELLHRADRIARERGAAIENKEIGTRVDIRRLTDAYRELFDLKVPAVLRVKSSTNTIAGKPAFIFLEVLPDKVVCKKGAVVASVKISGRNTQDELLALVAGELWTRARQTGQDWGMLGEEDGQPLLELSFLELQQVLAQAAASEGNREIQFVANRDLHRTDSGMGLDVVLAIR